jgi:hypothetical protein
MPLFSKQRYICCMCGVETEGTCNENRFKRGVCGPACFAEKEWRSTLSLLGKDYYPDPKGDFECHNANSSLG